MVGNGQNLPERMGISLCVDLEYPEELHNLHNDYPLAPEKVLINDVEKLAPNLGEKKEYHLTYDTLLYYLEKGMKLAKIHSGLSYMQEAFLKPFVEFNTQKRKEAKRKGGKFAEDFYKLANNSVYGKSFENVQKRCNAEIIGGGETDKLKKRFSQPHFVDVRVLPDSNMVMLRMNKIEVTLNKPIYLGSVILDKSKVVMYKFHYDYVMKKWGPKRARLLFTDTDSLTYDVGTEDVYEDMTPDVSEYFDTSKYPIEGHEIGIPVGVNMGVLGKFKDEFKVVTHFRGLRAKCYRITTKEDCVKRAKGVPKKGVVEKKVTFDHYDNCLRNNTIYNTQFVNLRSRLHEVTTDLIKKEALSALDDKRYLLRDGTHRTLAWFHRDIPEEARALCDASKLTKIVSTELTWPW